MRPLGTAAQVAELFQVGKDTVHKWVYLDKFAKGCYIREVRRFNLDKLERLIQNGTPFKTSINFGVDNDTQI